MEKQIFKMCKALTCHVQEYIANANKSNDKEYIQMVEEEMTDEQLIKPVTTIEFDYPYSGSRLRHFMFPGEQYPTTKHQLLDALSVHFTKYLQEHPYSAPHAIDDFVVEIIEVTPFNDSYASAYIVLGS